MEKPCINKVILSYLILSFETYYLTQTLAKLKLFWLHLDKNYYSALRRERASCDHFNVLDQENEFTRRNTFLREKY